MFLILKKQTSFCLWAKDLFHIFSLLSQTVHNQVLSIVLGCIKCVLAKQFSHGDSNWQEQDTNGLALSESLQEHSADNLSQRVSLPKTKNIFFLKNVLVSRAFLVLKNKGQPNQNIYTKICLKFGHLLDKQLWSRRKQSLWCTALGVKLTFWINKSKNSQPDTEPPVICCHTKAKVLTFKFPLAFLNLPVSLYGAAPGEIYVQ